MAELLIVAATLKEVDFLKDLAVKKPVTNLFTLKGSINHTISVLITGPGITATTYYLTKELSIKKYDLAINVGICGSLDREIKPVRLVNIYSECFGDFGVEDGNNFKSAFEIGLLKKNDLPFTNGILKATYKKKLACLSAIHQSKAITVQKVHGSNSSAKKAFEKYGPVMESMEGAAFFYTCSNEKVPSLQIRAVSNLVEKRNRASWKIKEAIDALAGFTGLLFLELEHTI